MTELLSILFYVSLVLFSCELLERNHISLRRFFGNLPSWRQCIAGIGLTVPLFLFSLSTLLFFVSFFGIFSPTIHDFFIVDQDDPSQFVNPIVSFLGTVIVAPLAEEFFFRGVLLHRFVAKWGFRTAFWVTSLFFGILHIQNALAITFFAFVLGILYVKTRSLFLPILCHMVYNLLSFIQETSFFSNNAESDPSIVPDAQSFVGLAFISGMCALLVGSFLVWYIITRWPREAVQMPYDVNKV